MTAILLQPSHMQQRMQQVHMATVAQAAALQQPNLMRGASAPPAKFATAAHSSSSSSAAAHSHSQHSRQQQQQQQQQQSSRTIMRATVVSGDCAAAAAACGVGGGGGALPLAAHVLADAADVELAKRLQSRLGTLGIGANNLKVEVRANNDSLSGAAGRSFTLFLTGRIQMSLGSLFNILIAFFLKQHTQITHVERKISFITSAFASSSSSSSSSRPRSSSTGSQFDRPLAALDEDDDSLDSDAPALDSLPILQIKIKHLAKLMMASNNTVVYTGDHLCQGSTSTAPVSTAAAPAVSSSSLSPPRLSSSTAASSVGSPLADLSAPHPPTLLAEWVRGGSIIKHIINENTDGFFNPSRRIRSGTGAALPSLPNGAAQPQFMSDAENSSCASDDDSSAAGGDESSSSSSSRMLPPSMLSEPFGNKYVELCSAGCGHPGVAGNASSFLRDFQVQGALRLPAPLRVRPTGVTGAAAVAQPVQPPSEAQSGSADQHLTGRFCSYCSAPLRDTLVGWNESLPRALLQRAVAVASQAELSVVLGSRLRVSPMCDLPALASASAGGSSLVIVQASATAKDRECLEAGGILIRATPATVLEKLTKELQRLRTEAASNSAAATPAIVRSSPSSSPSFGPTSSSAAAHPSRAISTRPASAQLAAALLRKDMKKRMSSSGSGSNTPSNAAALTLFSQRRGAPANTGASAGLARPSMLRASTAAPSLLSMGRNLSGGGRSMQLSANLPPFPSLDDDDDDEQQSLSDDDVPPPSARARAYSEDHRPMSMMGSNSGRRASMQRLSSVMTSAAPPSFAATAAEAEVEADTEEAESGLAADSGMMMMMQSLPSAEALMPPSLLFSPMRFTPPADSMQQ